MSHRVPARSGWDWIKQGFGLFRKQPGVLTALLFINLMITVVLGEIPHVGPLLGVVLIPSLSMATMQACAFIAQDQRVRLSVLATGFRKPAVIALCKLGLIYMGISLLLTLVMQLSVDPNFWVQLAAPFDPKVGPKVNPSDVFVIFGINLLGALVALSLCFAAPLAAWQGMNTGKATFYSFFAVVGAVRAFIVMLMAWFAMLVFVLTIVVTVLGRSEASQVVLTWVGLMLVLLLQCALYAAYRQIFGAPAGTDATPA